MIGPVRGRTTFDRFRTDGRRLRSSLVRATAIDEGAAVDDHLELAFVLPRRFGSAVERNRSRRRVSEAFRELLRRRSLLRAQSGDPAPLRVKLLVSPSRRTLTAPFEEVIADLDRLLQSLAPS